MALDVTLEELIAYLGQPEKTIGNESIWQCPICFAEGHDKSKDNLKFNSVTPWFRCFCSGAGGNGHAAEILREVYKRRVKPENKKNVTIPQKAEKEVIKERTPEEKLEIHNIIQDCHEYLLNNKQLLAFLYKERKITEDTVRYCKIGYSESRKRFTFPAYDLEGDLYGGEYRTFGGDKKFSKILSTSNKLCLVHKGISPNYILVEGFTDAACMYQYLKEHCLEEIFSVITPANGVPGVPGLVKEWNLKGKNLIVFIDNDEKAGKPASDKLEAIIDKPYKQIVLDCGCCKDMNDFIRHHPDDDIMAKIVNKNVDKKLIYSLYESINIYADKLEKGRYDGIKTGFNKFDTLTSGFQPGGIYVITGRPGMGKTMVALNFAYNIASQNIPVHIFSLETSKELITRRLVSIALQLKLTKEKTVLIDKLREVAYTFADIPLTITDKGALRLSEMENIILESGKLTPKLLVIDYAGLMNADIVGSKAFDETAVLNEICKGIKPFLANIGNPALLFISQLNRLNEGRKDKKPVLSDIKGSSFIEATADFVGMCFRDDYYYTSDTTHTNNNILEIIVPKQRDGPTGTVKFYTQLEKYLITELDAESQQIEKHWGPFNKDGSKNG
jgi:hypothetical protein